MSRRREEQQPAPATPTGPEPAGGEAEAGPALATFPDRLVMALLDDAKDLLAALGVRLSVVSIDEDRAVFVSEPANGVSVDQACDMTRRVLAQVADAVPGIPTESVELRCGRQSEWPCTFSLEWSRRDVAPPAPTDVPSLEMLIRGRGLGPPLREEPGPAPAGAGTATSGDPPAVATASPGAATDATGPTGATGATDATGPRPENRGPSPIGSRRRRFPPPWLRRRWWLLLLGLAIGVAGGYVARSTQSTLYSATSQVVVVTGAGDHGPGAANDAVALARTDASILPSDQALLRRVGQIIGQAPARVADHLSASAEAGTAVVIVRFDATTPSAAVRGANAVGRVVTARGEKIAAIPSGSLSLVQLATGASTLGLLRTDGMQLGGLLGLVIGLALVVALERADPRVDDVEDLARATGTAASAYPGPLSLAELEELLDRATAGAPSATLVPLSGSEVSHTFALRIGLESAAAPRSRTIELAGPVGSADARLTRDEGPTVLVVKRGARLRRVKESVQRLDLLGRAPVWAILALGRRPPEMRR
jgi:capsular polysaccharide biosynthesis protein